MSDPLLPQDDGRELALKLPRPVTGVHQIELSSRCSLRCVYCPSPHLARPKLDLSDEHLSFAIDHVKYFQRQQTQGDLNLAGIGESMMRDDFVECVAAIRQNVGPSLKLLMATNGLHLTEEIARALAMLDVRIWISLHRPEKAGPAVLLARRFGILDGMSTDPVTFADDWAGQVQWAKNPDKRARPCPWIRQGWAMVLADGRVSTCCLDASGVGVIGKVSDALGSWHVAPYKLCGACAQTINVNGYNQYARANAQTTSARL